MQDLVGIVRTAAEMERALEGIGRLGSARRGSAWPATGSTIRGGTPRWISTTCSRSPRRSRAPRSSGRRAAAATSATTVPDKDAAFGKFNIVVRKGADGAMQLAREPIPEMPAELKRVIEEQK